MERRTAEVRESGFTDHVLVCTNERNSDYACCATAGGRAVYEAVTSWLRDRDIFWSSVYVAETSCLGLCSDGGTAITIHPRNRWYSDVRPGEVPELLESEFGPQGTRLGVAASAGAASEEMNQTGP